MTHFFTSTSCNISGNPIHRPCTTSLSSSVLQQEMNYAFTSLQTVSKNESAWNYLYGIIRFHPESIPTILDKLLEYDITDPNSLANQRRKERRSHKNGKHSFSIISCTFASLIYTLMIYP